MKFEKILSQIDINGLTLKNRLALAPMVTNYCTREGYVTQRVIDYYETIAKGGVALIRTEAACISFPGGLSLAKQLGLYDDRQIDGLKELVTAVHKHDCKIAIQLHHAGHRSHWNITGYQPVSASEVPEWVGGGYTEGTRYQRSGRSGKSFRSQCRESETGRGRCG